MNQWATLIGAHLAGSRRTDAAFEDAWRAALAAHPVPKQGEEEWLDSTVKFAKEAFRDGYLRRGTGRVGALAERDFTDPSGRTWRDPTPMPDAYRCGWGGGCDTYLPDRGLCPSHAFAIEAVAPLCNVGACGRDALPEGAYCAKHKHLEVSNLRGNAARHGRLADAA